MARGASGAASTSFKYVSRGDGRNSKCSYALENGVILFVRFSSVQYICQVREP